MADKLINSRIKIRSDTSNNWNGATGFRPLLGEVIFYSDLNQIRIGDGESLLSSLEPIKTITDYISLSQKGQNNGVAELGIDGKVKSNQLPLYDGTIN